MKPVKITSRTFELTVNETPDATVNMALILGKKHNFLIDTGVGANSALPLLEIIKDSAKPLIVINTHGDDRIVDGEVRKVLPNVTFDSTIYFPEDGLTLFHTPFHTAGDINIYDSVDKILHIGDMFGFSEGKAYPWGKGKEALRRVVEAYKVYDFDICMSGHCPPQKGAKVMMEAAEPWEDK